MQNSSRSRGTGRGKADTGTACMPGCVNRRWDPGNREDSRGGASDVAVGGDVVCARACGRVSVRVGDMVCVRAGLCPWVCGLLCARACWWGFGGSRRVHSCRQCYCGREGRLRHIHSFLGEGLQHPIWASIRNRVELVHQPGSVCRLQAV